MTAVDQPARDRVAAGRPEDLFVEAGAGTGKTTALVSRVVTLVAEGTQLGSIAELAAITFTENAAAELRSRIREALTGAADELAEPADRARCQDALDSLDDAAITTLHGFAQRLLGDLPLEAGLPPGFEVQDDVRAGLAEDQWWSRFVDDSLADPDLEQVWRTALSLGLKVDSLKEVAGQFAASWDLLPPGPPGPIDLPAWDLDEVVYMVRSVVDRYADRGPQDDGLATHLREVLRPALAEIAAEADDLGVAVVLSGVKIAIGVGSAPAWTKTGVRKPDVVDALKTARDAWHARLETVRGAVLAALLDRVRVAVLEDAESRRAEGRLQFHDLLVRARDLLRDNAAARDALSQRWRVLLVDEFQDTDPLQAELVHLLTADRTPSDWREAAVAPGRLFFVGDPKQSIYRFRRADVGLYREVQDLVAADGRLQLTQNFRSRPAVLGVVNAALQPLMSQGGSDQVPYVPLEASRGPVLDDPGPDVLLLGGPQDEPVSEVRAREARHVATTCRRARDEAWLVREGARVRPVRFADIALLVPTRTSLGALEDALQAADVPYRVESRSLVWQTDAVRDLLTMLQAIDDPGDRVAVVAALRHPGFACTDDDLIAWRAAGGSWSCFAPVPEEVSTSPVASGLAELRRYHELRWWVPVNQLAELVVRERHLVELTTALPRPRDHWRRLRFVVDQARAYLDAGGQGLGGFVAWALQQAERGADAIESAVPEPDDDAVRILTVHASKGLEFPVVVLTGINVDDQTRGAVSWSASGPEVKVKGFSTPGFETARERDKVLNAAESVRVLYVGLTRAVDHLVVSLHHKATSSKNHASRLYGLLDIAVAAGAVLECEPAGVPAVDGAGPALPGFRPEVQASFLAKRAALLAAVEARVPVSPSALAGDVSAPAEEPLDPLEDVEDAVAESVGPQRPARGGAALGSVVHRALELVDLAAPDAKAAAKTAAQEAGRPDFARPAEQRVRAALGHPLLREAAAARHWKELPVVADLGDRFVEGYVDLVFERADGLVVVDYKTDAAADEGALAAKLQHYAPQLKTYAASVSAAAGRPVAAAALLFLSGEGAEARSL